MTVNLVFVLITFAIIILIYFIFFHEPKNSKPLQLKKENNVSARKDPVKIEFGVSPKIIEYGNAETKYVNKGIRRFELKGLHYRDLKKKHSGFYKGYAINENNLQDSDAVAIYINSGKHIGYLPKGSIKISKNLKCRKRNMILVWGKLNYNPSTNKFWGNVYIPIGFDDNQLKQISSISSEELLKQPDLLT